MANRFREIIRQLNKQKTAIEKAIAALTEVGEDTFNENTLATTKKRGRAAKSATKKAAKKRTLNPEARERIAAAQRKRWAAQKKAAAPAKKAAAKKAMKKVA
jgi:hypothetical protein